MLKMYFSSIAVTKAGTGGHRRAQEGTGGHRRTGVERTKTGIKEQKWSKVSTQTQLQKKGIIKGQKPGKKYKGRQSQADASKG